MSFPRYERYKASGVEWLGPVPEHWEVKRIKHLIRSLEQGWSPQCESTPAESFDEWAVLKVGCVNGGSFQPTENKALPADLEPIPALGIVAGDVLISRANTRELVGSAAVALADYPKLMVCDKLYRIRPKSKACKSEFLASYLGTRAARSQIELSATGASSSMLNIGQDTILDMPIAVPPIGEQLGIIAFLDRETAKIDALVEEQRRLIGLLKEKRQAVISHAVTKGLDPNAPMKDSGVEWLGQVPEHWEVVRIGRLFIEAAEEGVHELPVLSVSIHDGVSDKELSDDEADRKFTRSEDRTKYKRVEPNDLVYNMMRAWQGGFGTVQVEGMVSPAYVVARPRSAIHTRFVEHLLRAPHAVEEMRRHSHGVTDFRLRLYWDEFKDIRLAIPSVREQQQILAFIEEEDVRIDELIATAEVSITLLQERRAALISAAVTGKIDVRRPEARVQPVTQADRVRVRMIVAAEIVERLSQKAKFGRVKLQKLAYLAETHANVNELQGNYLREAAGPLDRDMIEEMEARLRADGFVSIEQPGGRGGTVTYRVKRRGAYREEAAAMLGSRAAGLKRLIDLLGDLETKSVEAIATLYAVWNDALLDGITPTDDFIIGAFLNDWHPEKAEKFKPADLRKWLDWMRRHELTPNGTGPRTVTGRLFA